MSGEDFLKLTLAGGLAYEQLCGHGKEHVDAEVTVPRPIEVRPPIVASGTTTTPAPSPSLGRWVVGFDASGATTWRVEG